MPTWCYRLGPELLGLVPQVPLLCPKTLPDLYETRHSRTRAVSNNLAMTRKLHLLLLSATIGVPSLLAQSPSRNQPLTRADILGELASGSSPSYVAHLVRTHGVSFSSDNGYLSLVQRAGGAGALLDRITAAAVPGSRNLTV
jgi:hypothetical protein